MAKIFDILYRIRFFFNAYKFDDRIANSIQTSKMIFGEMWTVVFPKILERLFRSFSNLFPAKIGKIFPISPTIFPKLFPTTLFISMILTENLEFLILVLIKQWFFFA